MTRRRRILLLLAAIFVAIFACLAANHWSRQQAREPASGTYVHIDGYEKDTGVFQSEITLWKNYLHREEGIVAKAAHGERVRMISFVGQGVLVERANGQQGWVSYWFIKELDALSDDNK